MLEDPVADPKTFWRRHVNTPVHESAPATITIAFGVDHMRPVGDTSTAGHLAAGDATGDEVWTRCPRSRFKELCPPSSQH